VLPTVRAARGHDGTGDAREPRGIGEEKGHGCSLTTPGCCYNGWRPRIEGAGVESRWRRVSWRRGAVLGSSGGAAALGHRGELKEAVAAEKERERAAAKKGGRSSACGSCAQQNSRSSRGCCNPSQSDCGHASRREGRLKCWPGRGLGCGARARGVR
jgi:hypothetical protein